MWRAVFLFFAVTASASAYKTPDLKLHDFYSYDEMRWYLSTLDSSFSNIELQELTKTHENRSVYIVKISAKLDHYCPGPKNVILLDAAIQGNEWITTTVALKTIHELVVNYGQYKKLLERFDWYILPMANPDGYEFSRNSISHYWKKNRSPNGIYFGSNLNRNFDTKWNKFNKWHPSSQEFQGSKPFSERESNYTGRLMQYLIAQKQHFLYITLQTKGNPSILYPSPYELAPPEDVQMLKMIADYASGNVFLNTKFHLKLPPIEHERFGGSSLDYAYEQGFPLTYGLEVFEVNKFEAHIRNFIADRAYVGWIGVFSLAEGALKYKCNVPREDKCRCFEERDEDERDPDDDSKSVVSQNGKSGSSSLINGKSSSAAKLDVHVCGFKLLWLYCINLTFIGIFILNT
ncbi:carboxypeptidase B-like [Drosophila subpulchrella]|uniref:carboxypeptidase B-like n=1 Tax=Drosophila subpulchrella TaxID=1486046 RepID=UPI0018A1800C|nr:carboxypeptidase B-like [Drosophila subpulchrella]